MKTLLTSLALAGLAGRPVIGQTVTLGIDNPLGTQSAGAIPALLFSFAPAIGSCGTSLANLGMAGGGAPGAFLIGLTGLDGVVGAPWAGTGNPAPSPRRCRTSPR